jgi:CRISPR-associated protein Cas1
VAKNIVTAKLVNYGAWLSSLPGSQARRVSGVVETIRRELAGAESIESVRGYEGSAARVVFAEINRRTPQPGFRSQGRLPREKPDRFNALLDFLYSMLFTRLNVLVRGEGLNPYLGFLHSARDDYESLVCDMQEPFRCRMDRLALKLINRREIVEGSFDEKDGRWRLNPKATGVLIEAFEREEQVRLAREAATLGELLSAQVLALRRWVEGDDETPALFVSRTRQSRSDRAS